MELQNGWCWGFDLFQIDGTQAGENMKPAGGDREGDKKHEKPWGREEGLTFPYSPKCRQWLTLVRAEGWNSFSPLEQEVCRALLLHTPKVGQKRRGYRESFTAPCSTPGQCGLHCLSQAPSHPCLHMYAHGGLLSSAQRCPHKRSNQQPLLHKGPEEGWTCR